MEYLESHNADPKPFIWTKSTGEILEKVARAKQALEVTTLGENGGGYAEEKAPV